VDARLHHVQGKAVVVTDLLALLQDFYGEKLDLMLRHQAAARVVEQYDFNNTYQYVINRDDVQLTWLETAILELGGAVPPAPDGGAGTTADTMRHVVERDTGDAQAFVDKWRPRVAAMTNRRHAKMLSLILGETLEQKRFFEQVLAGRTDLLGRRGASLGPSHGQVLPARWIE
jgi:hypothetical protein